MNGRDEGFTVHNSSNASNNSFSGFYPNGNHKFKTPPPIMSYGVILFVMVGTTPTFLLYHRRDSYEYMDFIRGVWANEKRLPGLFALMSEEEKVRIRNYTFQELWDDLWVDHTGNIYHEGYARAIQKYESVRNKIPYYLDNIRSVADPPWCFAKGKKNDNKKESDLACALRELGEETRISTTSIRPWPVKPFTEYYKGSNNKAYCTHYFLAECPAILPIMKFETIECIRQYAVSEEASDAKWFPLDEAISRVNVRRQGLLKKIGQLIQTDYNRLSPVGGSPVPDLIDAGEPCIEEVIDFDEEPDDEYV